MDVKLNNMKRIILLSISFIMALSVTLNAKDDVKDNGVAKQTTSVNQPTQTAKAETLEILPENIDNVCGCISIGKAIKRAERVYDRKFTNGCDSTVSFTYYYSNGEKWIQCAYQLHAGRSVNLSAGVDGRISGFREN